MILRGGPTLLLCSVFCLATTLSSCGRSQVGPKKIEADGVTYIACGGALWLENDKIQRDNEPPTFQVLYKDAQGNNHELKMVRMLKVTDLPDDTPACSNVR